jgi:hypothetical protein
VPYCYASFTLDHLGIRIGFERRLVECRHSNSGILQSSPSSLLLFFLPVFTEVEDTRDKQYQSHDDTDNHSSSLATVGGRYDYFIHVQALFRIDLAVLAFKSLWANTSNGPVSRKRKSSTTELAHNSIQIA